MLRFRTFVLLAAMHLLASAAWAGSSVEDLFLFQQAKEAVPKHYQYAVKQGARFSLTPDGKSFYLMWDPPQLDIGSSLPVIVTLHGHDGWAFEEFALWQPYAELNGYSIVAIQWWFGNGEGPANYYSPEELYPNIEAILKQRSTGKKTGLLHGFSRGATQMYALTAMDRSSGNSFFAMTLANAGGAMPDYPPNIDIENGKYGQMPFSDTHWVLFCAGQDPNPLRDGCEAMGSTKLWIQRLGGTVDLLIDDPQADHGGFHRNPHHVAEAIEIFERLLADDVPVVVE